MNASRSVLWLAALWLVVLAGCLGGRPASARIRAGDTSLEQAGAAQVPAKAERTAGGWETMLPAGVEVRAWTDGSMSWKTSAPQRVAGQSVRESVTGPQSFPPPAAPSLKDQADGKARFWAWIWIAAGAVAAGFGFTQGWRLVGIGGACVAAAGVCVIALSSVPGWIWGLGGVGVIVAAFGWAYWTFYLKPRQITPR